MDGDDGLDFYDFLDEEPADAMPQNGSKQDSKKPDGKDGEVKQKKGFFGKMFGK